MKTKNKKAKGLFQVNVDVGRLPTHRAEAHCKNIAKMFKKMKFRKKYGEVIIFARHSDPGSINSGSEIIRVI
jgi:hypothetical protein